MVRTVLISSRSVADMNVEKLQKMAGTVRTGGKGTVRRYGPLPFQRIDLE
jgi:hypothetical protein